MDNVQEQNTYTFLPALMYKNVKIRKCKTIIFLLILYGCEILSLSLTEVYENKVLRRMFGPKMDEVVGGRLACIMRSFPTCTLLKI
jgi:hypothetical protein